jgi:hypothetical protein
LKFFCFNYLEGSLGGLLNYRFILILLIFSTFISFFLTSVVALEEFPGEISFPRGTQLGEINASDLEGLIFVV